MWQTAPQKVKFFAHALWPVQTPTKSALLRCTVLMDHRITLLVQIHTSVVMDPNSAFLIDKCVKVRHAVRISLSGYHSPLQCSHTRTLIHYLCILVQMAAVWWMAYVWQFFNVRVTSWRLADLDYFVFQIRLMQTLLCKLLSSFTVRYARLEA